MEEKTLYENIFVPSVMTGKVGPLYLGPNIRTAAVKVTNMKVTVNCFLFFPVIKIALQDIAKIEQCKAVLFGENTAVKIFNKNGDVISFIFYTPEPATEFKQAVEMALKQNP